MATTVYIGKALEEAYEVDHHFHNAERWLGKKAVQGVDDWAEDNVNTPFVATSGNNTWGTEVQVLGLADTPITAGKYKFDLHRLLVVDISQAANPYKIRIAWAVNNYAAAIAAGQYSDTMFISGSANAAQFGGAPVDVMMTPVNAAGYKVWANVWCATNAATIEFFVGVHEYDEVTMDPNWAVGTPLSVTASTVSDKTGYALTAAYDAAKTAAAAGAAMTLTAAYDAAKTAVTAADIADVEAALEKLLAAGYNSFTVSGNVISMSNGKTMTITDSGRVTS